MTLSILEIGLLASMVMSCVAMTVAFLSLKHAHQQAAETEKSLQKLVRDIAASNSGSVGMGQRLLTIEKRFQAEGKKPQKIDYYNDEEFQPYSQAAQLFKMGIDCDEVARRCGLSRAEASLLEMMQKSSR